MNPQIRNIALWTIIGLLVAALVLLFHEPSQHASIRDITFSELLTQIDQGRVLDVTISGNEITGHFADNRPFQTFAPNDPGLVQRLQSTNVQISARPIGEGGFEAIQYPGGLPGESSYQPKPVTLIGKRSGDFLVLSGGPWARRSPSPC